MKDHRPTKTNDHKRIRQMPRIYPELCKRKEVGCLPAYIRVPERRFKVLEHRTTEMVRKGIADSLKYPRTHD